LFSVDGKGYDIAFIDAESPGAFDLGRKILSVQPSAGIAIIGSDRAVRPMLAEEHSDKFDFLTEPINETDVLLALKRMERKRRLLGRCANAEMRYTNFIEDMPLLIFRIMDDFSLGFMNRACQSMLGEDPETAMMEPDWFMTRVHDDDRKAVHQSLERVFRGFAPVTVQCRLTHNNGHPVHGILKTLPCGVYADSCGSNAVDCIFMDITERVHLENIMVQDEKLKTVGAISSEVAHEIRNPLVSIGGFARRLSAKAPDIPETDIILKESQRLEELLNRIRSYLDPVELENRPCSINELMVETVDRIYADLEQAGLAVRMSMQDHLPLAQADPQALSRVFINLIRNAAHALHPGGIIHASTYLNGGTVNASFTNELTDLKSLDPEIIYSPFQKDNFELPLAHRMIQSMGGHLSLCRDRNSAVFTVAVPIYAPPEEQTSLL
jgi:nitrogen-specific signal transduction histidine kinase